MTERTEGLNAFRSGAEYYEVLFDSAARLEREGPCLRALFDRAPGKRVVDLACGTGPHALFYAQMGAEVTAIDVSPEMIAHAAARRPHVNIRYQTGDLRAPEGGPWDLAVCLGNSICLLPSSADISTAFQGIYERLRPGGLFLLQVLNYAAVQAGEPMHRVVRKTIDGNEIAAVKSLVPAAGHVLLSLAFYAFSAGAHATTAESAVLLPLQRETVESLAGQAGFRIVEVHGGFDCQPYEPRNSADLLVLMQKA